MNLVRLIWCVGVAAALAVPTRPAAALTWDANPTVPDLQAGNGNWLGGPTWRPDGCSGICNFSWTNGSIAEFVKFGGGTIAVNGAVSADSLYFRNTGYTLAGSLVLTLNGANTIGVTNPSVGSDQATISAPIGGTGGFTKIGPGTLNFTGSRSNTYNGTATVADGRINLSRTMSGTTTITGNLAIGDGSGAASSAIIVQDADNQIPDTAAVMIISDGFWNLASGNRSETIGLLAMTAGMIDTGTGVLTVNGNITTNSNGASATISGQLNLGGATRTFDVADGAAAIDLDISAAITSGS